MGTRGIPRSKSYNALKTWGALKGSPNLVYYYSSSGKIKFNTTATRAVGATADVARTFTIPGRY